MDYVIAIVLGFIISNLFSFIVWALYQLVMVFFGIEETGFASLLAAIILIFYFVSLVLFPYLIYKRRKRKAMKSTNPTQSSDYIFCKNCGKKIDSDSKFCRFCRTKVALD